MGKRRTVSAILRFCSYELEELDSLVNAYGGLPRSSLVNIALNELLYSPKEDDFKMCRKHRVNLAIRPEKLSQLTQYAKAYSVHRTDLIRLAIRNFKQKYSIPDIPRKE
jgi:metal-responsive CopG/Arc/MetJ family transcriptional regulator